MPMVVVLVVFAGKAEHHPRLVLLVMMAVYLLDLEKWYLVYHHFLHFLLEVTTG